MLLLLGPPPSRAWLANRLKETAWPEAEAELEALWSSVTQVWYLVQGSVNGLSSLATSMSAVAELLGNRIDAAATNGIRWGSRFVMVAVVSHFPELDTDLEVLGSRCSMGLTSDEVDALWSHVRAATDSLTSHIPSSVARNPPDDAGEYWQ
jgi:hypothetical protein